MTILTWSGFSKRRNSTKQPTAGTSVTCTLKENCSIDSPVFLLATSDTSINYIQAFGEYFFVTNKIFLANGLMEIHCEKDVLATYKSDIASYSGLIEFTSSSSKVTMNDPRNYPTGLVTSTGTQITYSGVNFNTTGAYILGVLSDSANGQTGVVDYYALTTAQMQTFCNELYSQNILDMIKDQFTNAMDSLVSCIWLPLSGIGSGSYTVHIGRETMSSLSSVAKVVDRVINFSSGTTTIGFSALSGGSGADMTYLEKEPYCTGELFLPFVGWVPLDMDLMAYTKNIQIDGWIDILTGDIVYKVKYGGGWVSSFDGNIATKLPVTGASYDGVGVATGALTAIGGAVAAGAAIFSGGTSAIVSTKAMAGAAAAVGGGMSAAKSAQLHTMINGGNSSAIGARLSTDSYVWIHQYTPAETNLTAYQSEQGMPYFEVATLGSLSGYIKCNDASIDIPGESGDKDAVNSFLNNGFYYE